jgi:hypothetical protein
MTPDRESELLERIRQLEELNSTLQDKLDLIYEIVAPSEGEDLESTDGYADAPESLVNIKLPNN